mmetsp:Transcript_7564/g.11062  ORF Transcript_7564/g.11062 Transcript_7564/m.11062 type:complete len:281 (-) Transcript_7564:94-936(-)
MSPKSVPAYSNRGMVQLKLKDWQRAESDASSALQMDIAHVKSYQRRSVARSSLGKIRASLKDLYFARAAAEKNGMNHHRIPTDSFSKVELVLRKVVKRAPRRKIPIKPIRKRQSKKKVEMMPSDHDAKIANTAGVQVFTKITEKLPIGLSVKALQNARSWCEFEQQWLALSEGNKTKCLTKVQPQTIAHVYKNGMENSNVLLDILFHCAEIDAVDGIGAKIKVGHGGQILRALSDIPSIDLVVMMMSSAEKSVLFGYFHTISKGLRKKESAKIKNKLGLE